MATAESKPAPELEGKELTPKGTGSEKDSTPSVHDENATYVEAENADLALALSSGPKLKATSPRSLQLFAILLVAFMGSLSNGFDGSGVCLLVFYALSYR